MTNDDRSNMFWHRHNLGYRTTKAGTNIKTFLGTVEKAFIEQYAGAFNDGFTFSECECGAVITALKKEVKELRKTIEEQKQALENQQQFIDELMEIPWEEE